MKLFFYFVLFFLIHSFASAEEESFESYEKPQLKIFIDKTNVDRRYKKNVFDIKLMTNRYKYKEPNVMSIEDQLNGFGFSYSRNFDSELQLKFSSEYFSGDNGTYNGALFDYQTNEKTPYKTKGIKNSFYDLQATVGKDFYNANDNSFNFMGGFGYRNLNNPKSNQYSYDRKQTYNYLILNLNHAYSLNEKTSIRSGVFRNFLLSGTNKSGPFPSSNKTYKFTQKDGNETKIYTQVDYKMTDFNLYGELSFSRWKVDKSNAVSTGLENQYGDPIFLIEPANTTSALIFSVGAVF